MPDMLAKRQEIAAASRNAAIKLDEIEQTLRDLAEDMPDDNAWFLLDIGLLHVRKAAGYLNEAADNYYKEG